MNDPPPVINFEHIQCNIHRITLFSLIIVSRDLNYTIHLIETESNQRNIK